MRLTHPTVSFAVAIAASSAAAAKPSIFSGIDMPTPDDATICNPFKASDSGADVFDSDIEFACLNFSDTASVAAYVKNLEDLGWQTWCSDIHLCNFLSPAADDGCQRGVSMYPGHTPEAPKSSSVLWLFASSDCIPAVVVY